MRKNLLVPLALSLLFVGNTYSQEKAADDRCADPAGQTWTTHSFRQLGETIEIRLRGDGSPQTLPQPASVADCEPVTLALRWANGRNTGSNLNVTFSDGNNRPLYARSISAFMIGVRQFELSSFDPLPQYGASVRMISVPTTVTIEAVRPFAAPVNLSYMVMRVARRPGGRRQEQEPGAGGRSRDHESRDSRQGNEVVSIHHAMRLIGASRLPLIQIELRTTRPFPVRDVPLQFQIGKKVFIEELTGDHTGRRLTLSLTPEMFSELTDGDEMVAFFSGPDRNGFAEGDAWFFGKLVKRVSGER
ncbi:MAG: hypothetical protein AABN95_23035 [Acidobacteriota bacterium]